MPAVRTASRRVVLAGAKTRKAVNAVGSSTLRRTKSQRHQCGGGGAATGSQHQSYQRGPLAPAPALARVHPSAGTAARTAFTWRGAAPTSTDSLPDTAKT